MLMAQSLQTILKNSKDMLACNKLNALKPDTLLMAAIEKQ